MQKQFLLLLSFFVVIAIALGINHWMDKNGLPEIKANVNKQLIDLTSHSPDLESLVVGRSRQIVMGRDGLTFKGQIQYEARFNGSQIDLFVYWAGDSTNCQITRIEAGIGNSEIRVLWKPK